MSKSVVLFSKDISSEGLVNIYKNLGVNLEGNVAVKLHSGEDGNQNYVKPMFVKDLIDYVGGCVVECNTAYDGQRNSTDKHVMLMEKHGWSKYFDVDIMDGEGEIVLPIRSGRVIRFNIVGKNIFKYKSMVVLSHFKGHPMGGYGGALKQLSIGCASSNGKAYIHSAGKVTSQDELWDNVALDQACIDLIYGSDDEGKSHFIERVERQNGIHTIEAACSLGLGSRDYELICID